MQTYQSSPFFAHFTQDFAPAIKKIARALHAMPATYRNSAQGRVEVPREEHPRLQPRHRNLQIMYKREIQNSPDPRIGNP